MSGKGEPPGGKAGNVQVVFKIAGRAIEPNDLVQRSGTEVTTVGGWSKPEKREVMVTNENFCSTRSSSGKWTSPGAKVTSSKEIREAKEKVTNDLPGKGFTLFRGRKKINQKP